MLSKFRIWLTLPIVSVDNSSDSHGISFPATSKCNDSEAYFDVGHDRICLRIGQGNINRLNLTKFDKIRPH